MLFRDGRPCQPYGIHKDPDPLAPPPYPQVRLRAGHRHAPGTLRTYSVIAFR